MEFQVGGRIRAARTASGKSLRATAASLGISPSLLSQIENDKVQPSVSTLYAIVSHLGLSMDRLLSGDGSSADAGGAGAGGAGGADAGAASGVDAPAPGEVIVQRAADAPTIAMKSGVTWERLAIRASGNLAEPILATYEAGIDEDMTFATHGGLEYGYLIDGMLELHLEDAVHTLEAGDSLCFDASVPHFYRNPGDVPARGLWFGVGGSVTDH